MKPDEELHWISLKKRHELSEYQPYLSNLLNEVDYVYNKIDFQNKDHMIDTCGSHCVMFLWYFKNYDMDLSEYQSYIKRIHDTVKIPYDVIVAEFVSGFIKTP